MQQPQYPQYPPPYSPTHQPLPPYLQPSWIDIERTRAAAAKSYTNKAVFVLILYLFLWVPGLIANALYLHEAYQTKRLIQRDPDGMGCLQVLLILAIAPPLIGLVMTCFIVATTGALLR